ncbi:MAG: hypothetical protein O3B64_03895 [bacterium]|nr:hypothetical protein [bacterium]MDA1024728.1 hypothetical protein [bacterium]
MIARILIGLLISVMGILMAWQTTWVLELFGRIPFAERTFGPGGTRLYYKLLGVLVTIFGFIIMTNLFEVFFGEFVLSLFSGL